MSTPIVATFPHGWTFVANLEPDVRELRLLHIRRPVVVHTLTLDPSDAARIDLGNHLPGLYHDDHDRPVLFLMGWDGDALIWPCHRAESAWIDGDAPLSDARGP
jgi:hypothetical protein